MFLKENLIPGLVFVISFILISIPLIFVLSGYNVIFKEWGLISIIIVSIAILAMIFEFNRQRPTVKNIALIIVLGATVAMLRIPFAPLPNVQPCTFLIICSGIAFGSIAGFFIGIMTPLISNLFLGHGPWTPLQMYSWGIIGALSGFIGFNPTVNRWKLGVIGILAGYFYGFIMNVWFWYSFLYPHTILTLIIAQMQGIGFDTLHAIGNFVFLTLLGNRVLRLFNEFSY